MNAVNAEGRLGRLLVVLPTALALVAEAAWVSIVASMLQAFTLRPPATGLGWFLVAAIGGLVAARVLPDRVGERWPAVAAVLAIGAAAGAWLASPEVRRILEADGLRSLGNALAANLAAWLTAVAFVRGIAHARLPEDPRRIGNVLGLAIPGLAAAAIVGGMVAEPFRSGFLAQAQVEVLLFLVTGVLALALSRLALVATGTAVDWRRNPAWLALLVALLAGTAALAIAVSLFAGPVIVVVLGALFAPLLLVGFLVGFDRRSLGIVLLSLFGAVAVATLVQLFSASRGTTSPAVPGTGAGPADDAGATMPVTFGVLGVVLAVAVIALLVLARLWLRRPRDEESLVPETRAIDRGELDAADRRQWRGRFRRRPVARDAVAAYRALLADLDADPALRRARAETPTEHAERLRETGRSGLALDLLAADYGLARFGSRTLTAGEQRRALRRAALLRDRLLGS